MSSQWSSSTRVASGTAFGPMSGDPLSKEVSPLSASFAETVPEVASYRMEREATGPKTEAASTSGRLVESVEEEDVAVAVAISCLRSPVGSARK